MEIVLSDAEMTMAANVGVMRRISSIKQKLKNIIKLTEYEKWGIDICGAFGEMAVAKALGLYWEGGVDTFKAPDIGQFQVRSSRHTNGRLIVRDNDHDDDIFILVVGKAPSFEIVGWIKGKDAKTDAYLDNPNELRPAWFVPQEALHPISELKEKINEPRQNN